jgi:hypothetical protein
MSLQKGYTLLFAVLLSSMVLSISVSVLNIARKEVLLSSSARESSTAIYIADGALDCAVLQDNNQQFNDPTSQPPISCEGVTRPVTITPQSTYTRYTFYVSDGAGISSPCAAVTVDRYPAAGSNPAKTVIEARGYNVGFQSGTCGGAHPRKVERAFRYSYTM